MTGQGSTMMKEDDGGGEKVSINVTNGLKCESTINTVSPDFSGITDQPNRKKSKRRIASLGRDKYWIKSSTGVKAEIVTKQL